LNFDKFPFCVSEVKYLGTIISHEGMKPDPAKVTTIKEIQMPNDKAAVCGLLGMINYTWPHTFQTWHQYVHHCVILSRLIDVHFQWGTPAQNV